MSYLEYFNNRGRVGPMYKFWTCAAVAGLLLLVLAAIFLPPRLDRLRADRPDRAHAAGIHHHLRGHPAGTVRNFAVEFRVSPTKHRV